MDYQVHKSTREHFLNIYHNSWIGLAYFFGSQQELGPRILAGEKVAGAPESDLDLGVVLLEHPLDYWEGQRLRRHLEEGLAPLFARCACTCCCWRKKTPTCSTPPSGAFRLCRQ